MLQTRESDIYIYIFVSCDTKPMIDAERIPVSAKRSLTRRNYTLRILITTILPPLRAILRKKSPVETLKNEEVRMT